jgi:hypothetical protein
MARTHRPTPAEGDAFRRIDTEASGRSGAGPFTPEEMAALKVIAARELAKASSQRTGKAVTASYKLDEGLRDALKRHADTTDLYVGEALNQAIELYLSGRSSLRCP